MHEATGSPVAAEALRRIAELYAIEKTIRGQTAGTRQGMRHIKSRPLVEAMKTCSKPNLVESRRAGASPMRSGTR